MEPGSTVTGCRVGDFLVVFVETALNARAVVAMHMIVAAKEVRESDLLRWLD